MRVLGPLRLCFSLPGMDTNKIEKLYRESIGFQVLSVVISIVFGWAGINITWTMAKDYEGVTFGSLLFAAPLFTVFLLGALCLWFARMTSATNAALLAILKELTPDGPSPQLDVKPTASSNVAGRKSSIPNDNDTRPCAVHTRPGCMWCRNP